MSKSKLLVAITLSLSLAACDSAEDRKLKYYSQGKDFWAQSNLDKAKISIKNALKIDPNHIDSHLLFAQIKRDDQDLRGALGHYNKVLELASDNIIALNESAKILILGGQHDLAETRNDLAYSLKPDNADTLSIKASLALAKQDKANARKLIEQALAIEAGHIDASLGLASLYVIEQQSQAAIDTLEAALKLHPNEIKVLLMLAKVQNTFGDYKAALAKLERLLALEPQNMRFFNTLVDYQLKHFSKPQALATIAAFVKANPSLDEPKLTHVRLLLEQSQASAMQQLDQYIQTSKPNYQLRFAKAQFYLAEKNYAQAQAIYQAVIKEDGEQANGLEARTLLATSNLLQQQPEPAKALLAEVLTLNPNDAKALFIRGKLALEEKDVISAIADFRSVLRDDPNNIELLDLLARAHLLNNEPALAADQLRRILSKQADNVQARLQLSELLARQGQVEEALAEVQQGLQRQANNTPLKIESMKYAIALKRFAQAEQVANQLITNEDTAALGLYFLGLSQQAQANHRDAITLFNKALSSKPAAVEPVPVLVKSHLALGQEKQAKAWLAKHIQQQPQKAVSYNILGELNVADKDYPEAIKAFENAIKLEPKQWLTYRNLAAAHRQLKQSDQALAVLKQGIEQVVNKTGLRLELAAYHESLGQSEQAIGQYKALYQAGNKSDLVVNNLAMLLVSYQSQDAQSLALAEKLAQQLKNSDNPLLLDTAAWVYYTRQELDQALSISQRAASQAQEHAGIQYHLGMIYFGLNQTVLAKKHLEQALALNKPFVGKASAQETLAKL